MAHYAVINENNEVIEVINGKDETETAPEGYDDWQAYYQAIKGNTVLRTSYNTFRNEHKLGGTAFRGNYAEIGGTYDADDDLFYPHKPYPSYVKDATIADWVAPIARPDEQEYWWNEEAYQLDNTTGWELYPAPPE